MPKNTRIYDILYEISDLIDSILERTQGKGFQDYRTDRRAKIQIIEHFLAIQTLAESITSDEEILSPDIPWQELQLITDDFHHFEAGIDDYAVWEKARHRLALLQKKIDGHLP